MEKIAKEVVEKNLENLVTFLMIKEAKNITKLLLNNGANSFSKMTENLEQIMRKNGAKIVEEYCDFFDKNYSKIKPKNILIKNSKKTRKIITNLGEITLTRKLYFENIKKEYFFAFDEFWNIPKRERIDENIQSKLLLEATKSSYGRASCLVNVSRQTVFNIIKKIKSTNIFDDTKKGFLERPFLKKVFVEADEDHIHLQSKACKMIKLVYVHEGRRAVCKGRTELINPHYFTGVDDDNDKLWSDVAYYVFENYAGSRIDFSGDGANWIRQGEGYLVGSKFRLDKFHTYKAITSACYGDKKVRAMIINAVAEKDRATIKLGFSYVAKMNIERSKRKQVFESMRYILNNLDVIDLSYDNCTCAEGHVSHVLSARMSSRPMGWSKNGAERIARLRAYLYNGGDFFKLISGQKDIAPTLAEQKIKPPYIDTEYPKTLSLSIFDTTAKVVGFDGMESNWLTKKT